MSFEMTLYEVSIIRVVSNLFWMNLIEIIPIQNHAIFNQTQIIKSNKAASKLKTSTSKVKSVLLFISITGSASTECVIILFGVDDISFFKRRL